MACPPGRKPPEPQHLEEFLNRYSTPKSGQSGGSADSSDAEGDSMDSEKKSFVAKFIAQFESKSPKKNAFLKRRDSLEKARNSLRIYKERKRRGSLTKVHSPAQTTMTSKLDSVDGHGRDGLGAAGSLDALSSSPQFGKRSAFAMHDPKPVNIASTAKQVCSTRIIIIIVIGFLFPPSSHSSFNQNPVSQQPSKPLNYLLYSG